MKEKVFIFLDTMPNDQGSGARLRHFSNIQAFLDLGYEVEVIHISNQAEEIPLSPELAGVCWTQIVQDKIYVPNFLTRLSFRLRRINRESIKYEFPLSEIVFKEAINRYQESPESIFFFDGETQACVIPWMPNNMHSIWGIHDLPSHASRATIKISCDAESRAPTRAEERGLHFMHRLERLIAKRSSLVLCIGTEDQKIINHEFGYSHAEYFPMSIPSSHHVVRDTGLSNGKKLKMLHLGAIQHLPSYRSLEYLFKDIFPRLSSDLINHIELTIVGNVIEGGRSKYIKELAKPFQNVVFTGYVDDIRPFYEESDLQIVASTDSAGIRTRIIESFTYGLPVLSTTIGCNGIKGIESKKNILIADTPEEFIGAFKTILSQPEMLKTIKHNAFDLYEKNNSRPVVSATLSRLLQAHLYK